MPEEDEFELSVNRGGDLARLGQRGVAIFRICRLSGGRCDPPGQRHRVGLAVARGWDLEFESALLQERVACELGSDRPVNAPGKQTRPPVEERTLKSEQNEGAVIRLCCDYAVAGLANPDISQEYDKV